MLERRQLVIEEAYILHIIQCMQLTLTSSPLLRGKGTLMPLFIVIEIKKLIKVILFKIVNKPVVVRQRSSDLRSLMCVFYLPQCQKQEMLFYEFMHELSY